MEKKKTKTKIKGSSICIAVMFIGWIWYISMQILCYWKLHTWLPESITWGTIGLFLVETVSLARLKLAKEGEPIKNKIVNPMLKKLGVELPDFEEEVQEAKEATSNTAKENDEGKIDQS